MCMWDRRDEEGSTMVEAMDTIVGFVTHNSHNIIIHIISKQNKTCGEEVDMVSYSLC